MKRNDQLKKTLRFIPAVSGSTNTNDKIPYWTEPWAKDLQTFDSERAGRRDCDNCYYMVSFFRRIRQNLASERKAGNSDLPSGGYLKYAMGEIVLVVIGILIALQLNNWNTERIQNNESRELIKRLLLETNQNKALLKAEIDDQNRRLEELLEFLKMTGKHYTEKSSEKTDSLLYRIIGSPRFELNTSVLEEAISTGRLADIKSDSLRNLIYELPSVVSNIRDNIGFLDNHDNFFLYKRFYYFVSLRNIDGKISPYADQLEQSNFTDIDNRIILNDMQFESMVDNKYFLLSALVKIYKETDKKLNKLESMLSGEIKD